MGNAVLVFFFGIIVEVLLTSEIVVGKQLQTCPHSIQPDDHATEELESVRGGQEGCPKGTDDQQL